LPHLAGSEVTQEGLASEIMEQLQVLDVDALTPIEALELACGTETENGICVSCPVNGQEKGNLAFRLNRRYFF
jgi:hypothetical protein